MGVTQSSGLGSVLLQSTPSQTTKTGSSTSAAVQFLDLGFDQDCRRNLSARGILAKPFRLWCLSRTCSKYLCCSGSEDSAAARKIVQGTINKPGESAGSLSSVLMNVSTRSFRDGLSGSDRARRTYMLQACSLRL